MTDGPSPLMQRLQRALEAGRQRLAEHGGRWPGDDITRDHPLAKAIGQDAATALMSKASAVPVDRCPSGLTRADRARRASARRSEVRRMSLDGRSVEEIAGELGLAYRYVVQLRRQLGVGRTR